MSTLSGDFLFSYSEDKLRISLSFLRESLKGKSARLKVKKRGLHYYYFSIYYNNNGSEEVVVKGRISDMSSAEKISTSLEIQLVEIP